LIGKPDGRRPLGRRWANIRIDFREKGWDIVDWIRLTQDRG